MEKKVSFENIVKNAIEDDCACYVLITCSQPNKDGNMNIELSYEGDETLASFLIDNAAQVFENRSQCEESK